MRHGLLPEEQVAAPQVRAGLLTPAKDAANA
jgi:hypothetical protein